MALGDFYPSPSKLIRSEQAVLQHLARDPFINARHSQFAGEALRCLEATRAKSGRSRGFAFQSWMDLWNSLFSRGHSRPTRGGRSPSNVRLIIAGAMAADDDKIESVSYVLSVAKLRGKHRPPAVRRQFHFDIVGDSASVRQPHPQSHLQYCGKLCPAGCTREQLEQMHPWLSEPRILFWPMSLGLTIDLALHEFSDEGTQKFRSTSEWRALIRTQEQLLVLPFLTRCAQVITHGDALSEKLYVAGR